MPTREYNFDGLVGPTHNYAGLSHGNVASKKHQHRVSSPKHAALQGLHKMKFVRDLGVAQCVLPPLHRPRLDFLRGLGFTGSDSQLIDKAYSTDPVLVAICYSASNMWTANAATVSPSADTVDQRLHLTPANLLSNIHRSLETQDTSRVLNAIFSNPKYFEVHPPLLATTALSDEGAANHTRLCCEMSQPGLELFVFGAAYLDHQRPRPSKFPARQTYESVAALARRHQLPEERFVLIQQNPEAIDAGVFHNDVIAVGHQNVLLCHQLAFLNQNRTLKEIKNRFENVCNEQLFVVELENNELPIHDAVASYLFNSQIVTQPNGKLTLICPKDCEQNSRAKACAEKIVESDNPISDVHFLDLRQSMNNGGGPACLRLRVQMNEEQQQAFHQKVLLTDNLYEVLERWVEKHYRDQLGPEDLRDPNLIQETAVAMDELNRILELPVKV